MMDPVTLMESFVQAVTTLLEGPTRDEADTKPVYIACDGWNEEIVRAACCAAADTGSDAIVLLFEPGQPENGPVGFGVSFVEGANVRLQFGELWIGHRQDKAVLVPRGAGKRLGHFAIEKGQVVHRNGWPAANLTAGTTRAKRQLAGGIADCSSRKDGARERVRA